MFLTLELDKDQMMRLNGYYSAPCKSQGLAGLAFLTITTRMISH